MTYAIHRLVCDHCCRRPVRFEVVSPYGNRVALCCQPCSRRERKRLEERDRVEREEDERKVRAMRKEQAKAVLVHTRGRTYEAGDERLAEYAKWHR